MKLFKKGDTLMEVMIAISIFAMLMVGGLALMNSGLAKSQGTLQLTMARNSMDAQAEALRFINDAYIAQYPNVDDSAALQWVDITKNASSSASSLSNGGVCKSSIDLDGAGNIFVIDTINMEKKSSGFANDPVYPRIVYNNTTEDSNILKNMKGATYSKSEGLWVEAVKGSSNYYDFHIRACWNAPGSSVPTTLGTIVRLYDPAN